MRVERLVTEVFSGHEHGEVIIDQSSLPNLVSSVIIKLLVRINVLVSSLLEEEMHLKWY